MPKKLEEQFDPKPPLVESGELTNVLRQNSLELDIDTPGYLSPNEIGLKDQLESGETTSVVDVIDLGGEEDSFALAVVSIRDQHTGSNRLVLGGLEPDQSGDLKLNNRWIPLEDHSSVSFGRAGDAEHGPAGVFGARYLWSKEAFSQDVSRNHATISREGARLAIRDTSTNGTKEGIQSRQPQPKGDIGYVSNHTISARDLAEIQGVMVEKDGEKLFANRKHITRDTTDPEGMVDIRSWTAGGEAIVVDSSHKKASELYNNLYAKMHSKFEGIVTKQDVLNAIFETVSETMEYDLEFANKLPENINPTNRKVNLSYYLDAGKGVCRHMALACQWLGSKVAKDYPALFEGGAFTTPVNQRVADNAAHEWAMYTDKDGTAYILDPAHGFMGTLQEAIHDNSRSIQQRWEYSTDQTERNAMLPSELGKQAIGANIPKKLRGFFGIHKKYNV